MRIVIISDIHGNYDALAALPQDYDELWALGDLVNYGPQPGEVVDAISGKASLVVRGNHDHSVGFLKNPRCTPRYRLMANATGKFSEQVLTTQQKDFLRGLPLHADAEFGSTRFYLVHAMPSNPLYGYCPEDSDLWRNEAETADADILLVGHTHTPFVRRIGNRVICNPGSLGQPKTGNPNACYAVWENGSLELKAYAYPVEQTVLKIQSMPVPEEVQRDLITVLQTGSV